MVDPDGINFGDYLTSVIGNFLGDVVNVILRFRIYLYDFHPVGAQKVKVLLGKIIWQRIQVF